MQALKKDIEFVIAILLINNLLQVLRLEDNKFAILKASYAIFSLILVVAVAIAHYDIKKKLHNAKDIITPLIIYVAIFEVTHIILLACGIINVIDTLYGLIWAITILAYIVSFSHSILCMGLLIVVQLVGLIEQIFNYGFGNTDITLSSTLITYGIFILLIAANMFRCKKQIDVLDENKDKKNLEYYLTKETKPFKLGKLMHLLTWLIMISTVTALARYQFYDAMNSEYKYALIAAISITITTFIMLSALTTSVLVIETFAVYVISEIYTLSYLIFIQPNSWNEIVTTVIDCAILVYMIVKYRRITKKQLKKYRYA